MGHRAAAVSRSGRQAAASRQPERPLLRRKCRRPPLRRPPVYHTDRPSGARRTSAEVRNPAIARRTEEPDAAHDPPYEYRRIACPRPPVQCARWTDRYARRSPHRGPCERCRNRARFRPPSDVQRTACRQDVCGTSAHQRPGPAPGQAAGRHRRQFVFSWRDRRANRPHLRVAAHVHLERRRLHRRGGCRRRRFDDAVVLLGGRGGRELLRRMRGRW